MRDLFFVSCTRGAKEETLLYRSLETLKIGNYHVFENNQRGLPECYNESLTQLAGTDLILVLVHSDITIADVFVEEKLNDAVKMFNIVGLIGSSFFSFQSKAKQMARFAWPNWPKEHLSGAVEHVVEDGMTSWFHLGATPKRCIVLDGLFLAIDMRTIGNVRFDSQFSFHLYDIDFCLTAHYQSPVLGTMNIYVQHASSGHFTSTVYEQAMHAFQAKWTPFVAANGIPEREKT